MLRTQQLVVGIFDNHAQAVQAINELRQVGFDNRHVRFTKRRTSIDKIYNDVKSLLGAAKTSTSRIYNDLINMGMSPEDARYYQSRFEAGHSIVAVLKSGVPLVATSIIIRNGGYIVNEHFAEPTNHNQTTSKSTQTTIPILKGIAKLMQKVYRYLTTDQHPGAQKNTPANSNPTPSIGNSQNTEVQAPPINNINTEPDATHGHPASATDDHNSDETQKISKELMREIINA